MSKRSEEATMKAYPVKMISGPIGHEEQIFDFYALTRSFFSEGYEQAEKDLSLTPDDIKKIVDIYDECLSLTFEEGKPAYESEGFYREVLNRFLKTKEK